MISPGKTIHYVSQLTFSEKIHSNTQRIRKIKNETENGHTAQPQPIFRVGSVTVNAGTKQTWEKMLLAELPNLYTHTTN